MTKLTDEMKASIDRAHLDGVSLTVSAVDAEGRPNVSFRGSAQAHDDATIAMWVRNPETSTLLSAIGQNPHVALVYSDMATRRRKVGWIFHGRAHIVDDPAVRLAVFHKSDDDERRRDPEITGTAVLVALNRITGFPIETTGP